MAEIKPFSEEQIIERIRFENIWWSTGKIDEYFGSMKRRLYFEVFRPLLREKVKRAVVLMGPRRVGKTVMLFHTIQDLLENGVSPHKICYLSVETPIYNNIPLEYLFTLCRKAVGDESPDGFYIFFDEIQYLKNWEVHLKSMVDSYHRTKFIASGSAAAALKLKSNESGAGRFTDFMLPPLTFCEYISLKGLENLVIPRTKTWGSVEKTFYFSPDIQTLNNHFLQYINFGGYPEVIFSEQIQSNPGRYIRSDIVDKVLLRDLPSLYGIQDVQELNSLFTTIAYNSGNEFSYENLTAGSGANKETIKKYLTYLEAAFLIKIIHRIDDTAKRFRRANQFKIYLTNPSLRSALFSPISATDEFIGNMVETAIFSQWLHREDEIHYARWKNGEVDIVGVNSNFKPNFAVEIKWSNRFYDNPEELKSLKAFCIKNDVRHPLITSIDKDGLKEVDSIKFDFIPSSLYCYTLGKNALDNKIRNDFSVGKFLEE
ncbi:MAG: ATP-binding protein [Adhaeribacter sp.]